MSDSAIKIPIKLHHVLIVPFIVLMSISVLVTSYFTWTYSEETTSHLGTQISEQSAHRIGERLENYLKHADVANKSLKKVIDYGLIDINNHSSVLDYMTYIVKNDKEIGTLSIGYPDGSYIGISNTSDGTLLKKTASKTDRVFYTDELYSDGSQKQKQPPKPHYDARKRPWFTEAKDSLIPMWSTVFEMYSSGEMGVTYSESLHSDDSVDDDFIGVVGTDVVLHNLNEQLNKIRLTDNSFLFIIDAQKKVIGHSDLDKSQQGKSNLYTVKDSNNPLLIQSMEFIDSHTNLENKALHSQSKFTIDGETESYFINYMPYDHVNAPNWNIGVVIPKSDFMGDINEMRKNTFLIWVGSFLGFFAVGLLITYFLNRAIKRLHNQLDQIENSGFMYEHNKHSIREVNDLSIAFSRMSRRLYESYLDLRTSNKDLETIVAQRTEALKSANIELKKESHTDALTNLSNRRSFDYFIEFYWTHLKNKQVDCITLMMCDLDYFKEYNDTYGHPQGDECLRKFSDIIEESVGELDIATRYGGEEFAIIMPDATISDSIKVAKKIRKLLESKKIVHEASSVSKYVTISIGIATTTNTDKTKFELIGHADDALYQAKNNGRNCYLVYESKEGE